MNKDMKNKHTTWTTKKSGRVYISGSVTGTDDYMQRFSEAEKRLCESGYSSIVNPAKVLNEMPSDTDYEEYMKMSLTMLDMCDTIYMLNGWENSKGANREYGYALAKGMKVMYEEGV